jgi:hypothetical protein
MFIINPPDWRATGNRPEKPTGGRKLDLADDLYFRTLHPRDVPLVLRVVAAVLRQFAHECKKTPCGVSRPQEMNIAETVSLAVGGVIVVFSSICRADYSRTTLSRPVGASARTACICACMRPPRPIRRSGRSGRRPVSRGCLNLPPSSSSASAPSVCWSMVGDGEDRRLWGTTKRVVLDWLFSAFVWVIIDGSWAESPSAKAGASFRGAKNDMREPS